MLPAASELVAGPRGRRFLLALAQALAAPEDQAVRAPDPEVLVDRIRVLLAAVPPTRLSEVDDEAVLRALADSTTAARYWQEPDEEDVALADVRLADLLTAAAEAALRSPGAEVLDRDADPSGQVETVTRSLDELVFPSSTPAAEALDRWRVHLAEDERRAAAERPADPAARYSGEWWSRPWAPSAPVLETAARAPDGVPLRFRIEEDDFGPQRALARSRPVPAEARWLELRSPADWVDLVERYPVEVTASRRHDWWRATGGLVDGWYLPDHVAVARHHGAIHLSPLAYLRTAGRPMPVLDGHTLLAGWDPDATVWLSDLPATDEAETWSRDPDDPWVWSRERGGAR